MRPLQWLLVAVGVVLVLAFFGVAIGSAWLNSIVHSEAFRHEVETRAGQTLGGPVEIKEIDFGFFGGVKLRGVVTQIDSSRVQGQGALVANIQEINCTYSLLELLQRRLRLTGLTLVKPQIVLTRQPVAPIVPPAPAVPNTPAAASPPGGSPTPFQFILEAAHVDDGSLSIRDATGVDIADLYGVDFQAKTIGYYEGKDVTGKVKITDLSLPPNLHLTDFAAPFVFHTGYLEAKPIEASAFNGRLAGDYTLQPTGPSILVVNGKGLDVGQISRVANPTSTTHLSGSLDLQSKWRGAETGQLNGEGDLQLTGGKLEGVRVLQDLAGVLRINELSAPVLHRLVSHFLVENGQTRFTGLQLDASVFQMTGAGTIGADGALNADMVLILTRESMGRMPPEAAIFFVQQQDGSGSVAFHVGGTVNDPKTDLATRLFIQNMKVKNVISKALKKFFH
jgi:hypothetical protein